jgi:hypothetical protein
MHSGFGVLLTSTVRNRAAVTVFGAKPPVAADKNDDDPSGILIAGAMRRASPTDALRIQ